MTIRPSHRCYTLMEVTIAALLLVIAAVGSLTVVGTSRADVLREQNRRNREHHLANAVEFFLLAGPKATVPDGLLPDDLYAVCEVAAVEDELPEPAGEEIQGWLLGEYHIALYRRDGGELVGEQFVRKILKAEDDLGVVSLGAK